MRGSHGESGEDALTQYAWRVSSGPPHGHQQKYTSQN